MEVLITGIRGAAGYTEVISDTESTVTLRTGKVTAQTYNRETGEAQTVDIVAGQTALFYKEEGAGQTGVHIVEI